MKRRILTPTSKNYKKSVLILILLSFSLIARAQETAWKEPSSVRTFAYGKSGEWLYEGLQTILLPKTRVPSSAERTFELPVDWLKKIIESKEWFPELDFSAVDYKNHSSKATAYLACFPTKYYEGSEDLFSDYFDVVEDSNYISLSQKQTLRENASLMRERSMVFYLAYDQSKVQFVYYPGKIQFRGGARDSIKEWLPATPEEFKIGARTDHALIQNSRGLIGLFNGVFDKTDNFVRWNDNGEMRYAGFGYEFTTMMEPQPEMATFALYENGRIAIGSYRKLPGKESIRTFVQNRFMVIENGELARDSDPNAYCSFSDNIARAYLFTDVNGRIGYLWSLYTPVNVLAPIALEMGIKNMMLLDIHSAVSCSIVDPAGPFYFRSAKDYLKHSYDLVPNFFRLSPLKSSLTWISTALNSRIQTHYPMEAFKFGAEDYFAVFLKDAPEAKHVRKLNKISKTSAKIKPAT